MCFRDEWSKYGWNYVDRVAAIVFCYKHFYQGSRAMSADTYEIGAPMAQASYFS